MKRFFYTCLIWLNIHLHVYLLWSRLHQFLFQRKRTKIPTEINSVDKMMEVVRKAKWTADTWWMAWDAISHPEWAYHRYLTKGTLGDCDDYAAFSAYCLQQLEYEDVCILSVQWLDSRNNFHGHNVALYTDGFQVYMVSNGFSKPMPVSGMKEAAEYWAKRSGGELLAWCIITPDLKSILIYKIGK